MQEENGLQGSPNPVVPFPQISAAGGFRVFRKSSFDSLTLYDYKWVPKMP